MDPDQFARDVEEGLSSDPKRLSSKYFYDEKGDRLFQQIMAMDEYYLTRSELEIFQTHKEEILEVVKPNGPFRVVELGAGDGSKTKVLLKYFQSKHTDFSYCPVDISANVLKDLENNIKKEIPDLQMETLVGDYFKVLSDLKFRNHRRTVAFFLGSNIGNFLQMTANKFLTSIHDNLQKDDLLMIGFDLKKEPVKVLSAYNDRTGITSAFNKNLLYRINDELGGNFKPEEFLHYPVYDPMTGECRSYLVSMDTTEVFIEKLAKTYVFRAWEPIFTEVSKKYDLSEIDDLAAGSGFERITNFFDSERNFVDSIWRVK